MWNAPRRKGRACYGELGQPGRITHTMLFLDGYSGQCLVILTHYIARALRQAAWESPFPRQRTADRLIVVSGSNNRVDVISASEGARPDSVSCRQQSKATEFHVVLGILRGPINDLAQSRSLDTMQTANDS